MIKVIRVENNKGEGFWTASNDDSHLKSLTNIDAFCKRHDLLSTPSEDMALNSIYKDEYCAFYNEIDLKRFLYLSELKHFSNYNFRIYEMILSKARLGECQVLFRRENIISKKDITEEILNNPYYNIINLDYNKIKKIFIQNTTLLKDIIEEILDIYKSDYTKRVLREPKEKHLKNINLKVNNLLVITQNNILDTIDKEDIFVIYYLASLYKESFKNKYQLYTTSKQNTLSWIDYIFTLI